MWRALTSRGTDFSRVAWSCEGLLQKLQARAQRKQRTLVVCRTTWDYCDSPSTLERFLALVADLDALPNCDLLNSATMLKWNTHKRYLGQLPEAGVNIIPTCILEPGADSPATVASLATQLTAPDGLVVKPAVSNSACGVFLLEDWEDTKTASLMDAYLSAACSGTTSAAVPQGVGPGQWSGEAEVLLAQPFQAGIREWGELSVMVLGGVVTHAVVKRPPPGGAGGPQEFKVQEEYGGREQLVHLPQETAALAQRVVAISAALARGATPADVVAGTSAAGAVPPVAIARVDFVRRGGGLSPDNLALMEVECVEPSLFFKYAPEAADVLAEYLIARLHGGE